MDNPCSSYFVEVMMITLFRRWLGTAVFILPAFWMQAQTSSTMTGEYYLKGVTEVASGFKLNADSTFQFFFIYGALDRYGTGNWQEKDGNLVLNSRPQPSRDFALVTSKAVPGDQTSIRIIESNSMLLPYVHARFSPGNADQLVTADQKGMILLPKQVVDSITLVFEFCPERHSTFSVADTTHNYFEFRFEPWLMEVFFNNFTLQADKNGLYGKHPLMEGAQFRYNK
jgi:hypothetical protein